MHFTLLYIKASVSCFLCVIHSRRQIINFEFKTKSLTQTLSVAIYSCCCCCSYSCSRRRNDGGVCIHGHLNVYIISYHHRHHHNRTIFIITYVYAVNKLSLSINLNRALPCRHRTQLADGMLSRYYVVLYGNTCRCCSAPYDNGPHYNATGDNINCCCDYRYHSK